MDEQSLITEKLNKCDYITLDKLVSWPFLNLRIDVMEVRVQEKSINIDHGSSSLNALLKDARPIMAKEGYAAFTIFFDNYICYSVRDEIFAVPEKDEDYSRCLRTYRQSAFLDFVANGTWASSDHPGSFIHYAVVCLDHVIDIASTSAPLIKHRIVTEDDLRS